MKSAIFLLLCCLASSFANAAPRGVPLNSTEMSNAITAAVQGPQYAVSSMFPQLLNITESCPSAVSCGMHVPVEERKTVSCKMFEACSTRSNAIYGHPFWRADNPASSRAMRANTCVCRCCPLLPSYFIIHSLKDVTITIQVHRISRSGGTSPCWPFL